MKHRILLSSVFLAVFLSYSSISVFSSETGAPESSRPKKIALVLAGGGALGFAHIGAIKVLETIGLPIDLIVGTSMGSIVGGLTAAGYSSDEIKDIAVSIDWNDIFVDSPARNTLSLQEKASAVQYFLQFGFNRYGPVLSAGLTSGQKILNLLSLLTLEYADIRNFDDLPIPFRAVATDLLTGDAVVLGSGTVANAMRASMSIPGVFTPVELDGKYLIDGGLTDNLPVDAARKLGADIVIAVDLTNLLRDGQDLMNPIAAMNQVFTILIDQNQKSQRLNADIVIRPELAGYTSSDFIKAEEIIKAGEEAAQRLLPELKNLVSMTQEGRPEAKPQIIKAPGVLVTIESLRIAGAKTDDDKLIRDMLSETLNHPSSLKDIHNKVTGIYETGRYKSVRYSLQPGDRKGKILDIQLDPRINTNNLFGLGLTYESFVNTKSFLDGPVNSSFILKANVTLREIWSKGSYWSTDVSLLSENRVKSEVIQPFWDIFYISPVFYASSNDRLVYDIEDLKDEVKTNRIWSELKLGILRSTIGRFAVGGRVEGVHSRQVFSENTSDNYDGRIVSLVAQANRDTLDRFPFPSSGWLGSWDYQWGNLHFHRLQVEEHLFLSPSSRTSVELSLFGGSFFDSQAENYNLFYLGGRTLLPGFIPDSLSGSQAAFLGIHVRYKVPGLEGTAQDRLFLSFRLGAGNAWDETLSDLSADFHNLRFGGSAGIGLDSPIGAIHFDFGMNDNLEGILYVSVGGPI